MENQTVKVDGIRADASLKNKKIQKILRKVGVALLAVASIVAIYWVAIEVLLRDYENISYMSFSYDTSLEKGDEGYGITITKLDRKANYPKNFRIPNKVLGRPVIGIGPNAFASCDRLTSLSMPNTITTIDTQAFINCTNLSKIQFSPNIDFVGVDAMKGSKWLENHKNNTAVVIGEVFYGYNGLFPQGTIIKGEKGVSDPAPTSTLFYINDLDEGRNVNYIAHGAFRNQTGIVYFEFPDDIENVAAQILEGCTSLETIVFHDGVEIINSGAFRNTTSLEEINLPDSIVSIGSEAFYNSAVKKIEIPDSVTIIDNSTFMNCTELEELYLPEGLLAINNNAFENCVMLKEVVFPQSLTSINNAAFRGTSIKEIEIPSLVGVISESVFENCPELEKVTLHDNITSIRKSAFRNDIKLQEITLPNNLSIIGQFAFENTILEEIKIPSSTTRIEEKAFFNCVYLNKLEFLSDSTPQLSFIGTSAFENTIIDGDLILPNSVSTIQPRAFANTKIDAVELSNHVDLTAIAEETFYGCSDLARVVIPTNITNIKTKAFAYCSSLQSIYLYKEIANLSEFIFLGCAPNLVINCEKNELIKDNARIKDTWDVIDIVDDQYVYATVNFGVARP